jgi:2-amino-4-hydroxy-6-hydroxymethyldihydropteridine diphosphokinase
MADVVIALGSNLGNSLGYLKRAVLEIKNLGSIVKIAPLYRSRAYGYHDQPDFLNTAIILKTELKPLELLTVLKKIELDMGRTQNIRWGPREIDLDIILYNQRQITTDELTVPHADFHNRIFVLLPLSDIAPEMYSPSHNSTIFDLLKKCKDTAGIKLLAKNWFSNGSEL